MTLDTGNSQKIYEYNTNLVLFKKMSRYSRVCIKAIRRERDADAVSLFGRFENAATIYADIARMFWTERMYDDVAVSIIKASECLMKADMADDAFDGIRSVAIMMANNSQVDAALRLGGYVRVLETRYPSSFKNSSAPFESFIYGLCKRRHLIE
jgi:hypothetical protein